MLRPYTVLIDDKPRPSQRSSNLVRPIRERHGDAGHVHDIRERARPCNAGAHEQRSGAVGGKREYDPVRFGRRASGERDPPASAGARQAGDTLAGLECCSEPLAERGDRLTHPRGEAPESCCDLYTLRLDAEYRGGTPFLDGGELAPGPQRGPAGALIHHLIPNAQLPSELGQLRLARKKTIGPALDDESLCVLGHDHAARPALALVHRDLTAVGPHELPRRR